MTGGVAGKVGGGLTDGTGDAYRGNIAVSAKILDWNNCDPHPGETSG